MGAQDKNVNDLLSNSLQTIISLKAQLAEAKAQADDDIAVEARG